MKKEEETEPERATCPNGHDLKPFFTPSAGFSCSVCGTLSQRFESYFGCSTCDYDECEKCRTAKATLNELLRAGAGKEGPAAEPVEMVAHTVEREGGGDPFETEPGDLGLRTDSIMVVAWKGPRRGEKSC